MEERQAMRSIVPVIRSQAGSVQGQARGKQHILEKHHRLSAYPIHPYIFLSNVEAAGKGGNPRRL
jgi:hypothetical protein